MKRPESPYDNLSQISDKNDFSSGNCKEGKNGDEKRRRRKRNLFIGVCQDIDDVLGILCPLSPNRLLDSNKPNTASNLSKTTFDVREVDASDVKVHESIAMRSQVEAYTEEIDSSAIRIRENKGLVSQLKEISEKEEEDNVILQEFKDQLQNKTNSSRSKLDDCSLQLYKYQGSEGILEADCYGPYLDSELTISDQAEDFEGFQDNRKNAIILRTRLSVRVHAIIETLLNSSGGSLRRALFALKQIFQNDKDLVHAFVQSDGLACLIKIGSDNDQNLQNYILRALGQVMLYVDGMNGVIEHNETIQWLYSLISSQYRLIVKTSLKLLLVFVEYADSNCRLLIDAINLVDSERGAKSWYNVITILSEKSCPDIELLVFAMTLVNKTLAGIGDQDAYYDVVDSLEEQGMERTIQYYMSKQGIDMNLLRQFQIYEAVLRHEDDEDEGETLPPDAQRSIPRSRSRGYLGNSEEDRRKSRRHSVGIPPPITNCKITSEIVPSWQRKVTETTEQFNKRASQLKTMTTIKKQANGSAVTTTSAFDDITPGLRRRREIDARNNNLIKQGSDYNSRGQRASICSCSSADSYGSTSSGASSAYSLGSNEEKSPLIETTLVPASHSEIREEEMNKRNKELSSNCPSHWNLSTPNDSSYQRPASPLSLTRLNGLSSNNNMSEKKSWMLSMMYSKSSEDCENGTSTGANNLKSPTSPEMWSHLSNSTGLLCPSESISGSSIGVKKIQERILQSPSNERICSNIQLNQIHKEIKSVQDYLRWDTSLNRPLLIDDLDFTDLKSDDDNDIFQINYNQTDGYSPIPPPPPPPLNNNNNNNNSNQGLVPPPPPPPSFLPSSIASIIPPPPPPLTKHLSLNCLVSNQMRQQISPSPSPSEALKANKNKKTVKLFWKEVKEDKSLLSRLKKKKTIWDDLKLVPIDTQKLEHLFENRSKELTNKEKSQESKKNEIIVLDTKRSNAINIGMTKLPPPRTIKTAILKMDSTIMNREGIEKILTMMPTEDEKNKISEAQMTNPELPLGNAENFLLILSSITDLEARLKLWAFKLDYDLMEKEIGEHLMDLKKAIEEIEKSETFRIILSTLLSVGNFLNGFEVKGFQIDYLSKVPEVKDTVHKHSLLHHLCYIVIENFPKSSDLYSEFGSVTRASKIDFDEVSRTIQKLETDCKASWDYLKAIAKHDGSTPMKAKTSEFLLDCAERITVLKIVQRRVANRFKKLLIFLGFSSMNAKEAKPNQVLKTISEFSLEYRTTRERVKEQIEKKANHRERNKTRGKLITETDNFKSIEQQDDQKLRKILDNGYSDHENCNPKTASKWGTKPGFKTRQRSNSTFESHCNGLNLNNLLDADDEILNCLVKNVTAEPLRAEQRIKRKTTRFAERKSFRRTRNVFDLSEEERMVFDKIATS